MYGYFLPSVSLVFFSWPFFRPHPFSLFVAPKKKKKLKLPKVARPFSLWLGSQTKKPRKKEKWVFVGKGAFLSFLKKGPL
jgi:hypothetical protein